MGTAATTTLKTRGAFSFRKKIVIHDTCVWPWHFGPKQTPKHTRSHTHAIGVCVCVWVCELVSITAQTIYGRHTICDHWKHGLLRVTAPNMSPQKLWCFRRETQPLNTSTRNFVFKKEMLGWRWCQSSTRKRLLFNNTRNFYLSFDTHVHTRLTGWV